MNAMRNDRLRMNRRRFLQQLVAGSVATAALPVIAWVESVEQAGSTEPIRTKTLSYINSMRLTDGPYGRFRYSADVTKPTALDKRRQG